MSPDPGQPAGFNHQDFPRPRTNSPQASVRARLAAELATVRTELGRVDAKTNTLFAVCGVLLAGGINVIGKLTAAAAAAGWTATALVTAAVVLLLLAARPNLTGSFGFMAWAATRDGQGVLDTLRRDGATALDSDADALHHLSVMLRAKYRAVQRAGTLLITGLGAATIAAVLAVWAR
jgi:Pycsar effector protein